jgi:4-hydroxy-2-oxoheptanedioate aldolase
MNGAELKATLKGGGRVFGTMLSIGRNPRWIPILDGVGLDYVVIDTEHNPRSRGELGDYLAMLNTVDLVPIVRIPIPDSHYVTMVMDAGAQGVLAPYCETVEQVEEVVAAVKWRPLKGEAVRRLMDSGEHVSDATRAYLEERNKNSVAIIGIESVAAVNNLQEILNVPGIDGIFVGPNDMSISLGFPDQYDRQEYQNTVKHVIDTAGARGIAVLVHHQTPELSAFWIGQGARFVLHGTDRRALAEGFRTEFARLREVASDIPKPADRL